MVELELKVYRVTDEEIVYEKDDVKLSFTIYTGQINCPSDGCNTYIIDPDDTEVLISKNEKDVEIKYEYDFKADLIECIRVEADDILYFDDSVDQILKTWVKD